LMDQGWVVISTGTCGQDPMSCQKSGMDRNYCLIVFIVYMSYSDT
jgi:hypothetical protein